MSKSATSLHGGSGHGLLPEQNDASFLYGDTRALSFARSRFDALRNHPPTFWDENAVRQFHEIVTGLEQALVLLCYKMKIGLG